MRAQITFTVEYDINPDHYPEGATPEEMLAVDLENAEEMPYAFIDMEGMRIMGRLLEEPQ